MCLENIGVNWCQTPSYLKRVGDVEILLQRGVCPFGYKSDIRVERGMSFFSGKHVRITISILEFLKLMMSKLIKTISSINGD